MRFISRDYSHYPSPLLVQGFFGGFLVTILLESLNMGERVLITYQGPNGGRRCGWVDSESPAAFGLLPAREGFDPKPVIRRLFGRQITPAGARRLLEEGFRRDGVTLLQAYERLKQQQRVFEDGNFSLTRRQAVDWDHLVICFQSRIEETGHRIEDGDRLSNRRLVPPGTSRTKVDLDELAF
ncbi:MAG: hypothetical protein UU21_C0014G0011 [Candidatus Levybacteria bacterium GW2011_GWA2_40_8]|nr:MAG: hypothetical protein UU21_C0014G0011 [Candidatus Levybacteria bacterium GW2011_GWA2_40_8]